MIFEITGDESGLKQSLKNAGNSLSDFNNKAGGAFGNVDGLLTSSGAAFSTFAGGVGAAGLVIAGTLSKISSASDKAFEVFQASALSQTALEPLQKMANMFAEVGLSLDQTADQVKDSKDKLGDALTNNAGSMLTDVIQPLKLNILDLQKAADAGEDIIAKIYYQAKQMGFSNTQIINMMETVANDATKRMTIYEKFNNEQEYQNSLADQSVQLTGEQAKQFEEYRKATLELSRAWESWNNNALAPIAARLAGIINQISIVLSNKDKLMSVATGGALIGSTQILEDEKKLQEARKKMSEGEIQARINAGTLIKHSDEELAKARLAIQVESAKQSQEINKKQEKNEEGYSKGTLQAALKPYLDAKDAAASQIKELQKRRDDIIKGIKSSPSLYGSDKEMQADIDRVTRGTQEQIDAIIKKRDAGDNALAAKAEAAATKAAALEKQRLAKQVQAQKVLDQTMAAMGANAAQVKLQQFNLQQDEIEKRIKDSAKLTKKSEAETNAMLSTHYADRARNYKEMVDQMLAENDRLKQAQNIAAISNDPNATPEQKAAAAAAGNKWATNTATQGLGYQDPFNTQADPTKLAAIGTEQQNNQDGAKALYEAKVIGFQEYQDQLTAIQTNADIKRARATADALNSTIGLWGNAAGDIGTTLAGAFGEGNDAAKAFFAVQKGIAIAQSIINIQQGISEATKLGWPAGIAAGLKVAAEGANIIRTIKGTTIQGQAHDGWDSLPSTGTYNLEKGERVVGKSLNQDLTNYLKDGGNNSSGDIKIEAPLVIQSNGDITDKDFTEMCKKHADVLVQAVRQSQQRNV